MQMTANGRITELRRWRTLAPLLLAIGAGIVAYAGMLGLSLSAGTLRDGQTPATLAWYGLAFAGYLGALWWSERNGRMSMMWIWVPAVLFRLILLFTTPTLSDDVYRYLWDGYIANQGISPYAFAVSAPELDALTIPLRDLVNHTSMSTPYLPAAQGLFFTLARFLPTQPIIMQVAMTVFDLLSGVLIMALLGLAALPLRRVMIYLWNPLVVVEVAHGAHVDAWMIFLALLAVWLALRHGGEATQVGLKTALRGLVSPVVLAFATLTKLLPVLMLPVLVGRYGWRYLLVYGATLAAILVPVGMASGWGLTGPLDGAGLFGALRIYGQYWNFNSGLFHWLEMFFLRIGLVPADRWAKMLVAAILLAVLVWVWRSALRAQSNRGVLRLLAVPLIAYVLLSPTFHPWYLLLLLAFTPFLAPASDEASRRWRLLAPWLYLSGAVALSYLTYLDPQDFRELEWVRWVQWLPTLALLVWAVLSNRKAA